MKCVFATTEFVDLQLIRLALGDHGIDAMVEDESSAIFAIGMPTAAAPFRISVRDEDEERARNVIHDVFENRRKKKDEPESPEDPFPKTVRRKRNRYRWLWLIGGAVFLLYYSPWNLDLATLVAALVISVFAILALPGADD